MSDLLKPAKQIRIEKSVDLDRTTTILDNTLKTIMSDGDPAKKGAILVNYTDYQKAAGFTSEAEVTNMLTTAYLKGAVDQIRAHTISKSAKTMQCTSCLRNHPFQKSLVKCPCGNELEGITAEGTDK